ncbi:hypothetical protein [Bradyrhizobium iriomotense]|uniref:Uncharacterized protein n=1 Tax=Bradyrhizobium iriomotense TaxID=441950 RepID=A0ABQ6AZG3_9BRAD|nr:hypothetical protein [Bradyrhizobium iriomotense]GLR86958.1 hypothetical protein GCM10007857_36690 [Bradyrhizobium iriomotense]
MIDSKQASEALAEIRHVHQSLIDDLASQIMMMWGGPPQRSPSVLIPPAPQPVGGDAWSIR